MNHRYPPPEQQWRRRIWQVIILVLLGALLFIALPNITSFVTEWLWFSELRRADVFWKLYWGPWLLGSAVGLGFFILVFTNILIAVRKTPETLWNDFRNRMATPGMTLASRTLRRLAIWASAALTLLVAVAVGKAAAPYWSQFLLFLNAQSVGGVDPIFQKEIGFYLFRLPIWELLGNWLFFALLFTVAVVVVIYLVTRSIRTDDGLSVFSKAVQWHLSLLLALLLLVKAAQYYLGRFSLL